MLNLTMERLILNLTLAVAFYLTVLVLRLAWESAGQVTEHYWRWIDAAIPKNKRSRKRRDR